MSTTTTSSEHKIDIDINKMLQEIDDQIVPPKVFEKAVWNVVDEYFKPDKGQQLIKHQIESFNDFVLRKIEQIIDGFNPIEVNHMYNPEKDEFKYNMSIIIENPTLMKPIIYEKDGSTKTMTPNDARLRNFTYASAINVDMSITARTLADDGQYVVENKRIQGVSLGKIPIMVKSNYCILKNQAVMSNECKYDYGGYFIINGNEKVIISQDRISENKTFVFINNKVSTYSHIAEIRSVQENRLGVPKITTIKMSAKPNQFGRYIRVNIHHIKTDIPLFILFKALGLNNDKEIMEYIAYDLDSELGTLIASQLMACVDEANHIMCERDAIEYLAKYLNITGYPREYMMNKINRINLVRQVLEKEVLPHVGKDLKKKALYIGSMVNKLIQCFLRLKEFDDRDSYINKRVDTPGVLLASIFRQYYGKMIKDMKNMIQKEINVGGWKVTNKLANVINKVNVYKIVKSTIIDSGLRYALSTGNWGIKSNKNKQGVAQVLNRMSYNATLSHLRRINTPIEKSGKLIQPRKLHPTQWGIICPAECFDPNTPILLWDGKIKKAKDIIVGDYLIDDKGNSVKVRSTCSGFKGMYEIIPDKKNFMTYTVTDNHILTLAVRNHKQTRNHRGIKEFSWFDKNELKFKYKDFNNNADLEQFKTTIADDVVIDITIENYLALPNHVQNQLYLFKTDGINWEHKDVLLDPYILGMWLGDSDSSRYGFTTADKELLNEYNLIKNKHIPLEYLVNDRKTRLAILAGIIDTNGNVCENGHEIRICQEEEDNYRIIYDAEFLARSLGFSCHLNDDICSNTVNGEKNQKPYKELIITGSNLYEIPTVLPKNKLNKFDNSTLIKKCSSFLQSSFKLVRKDVQPYVGWQVEGNGRFLLGDMSVTHNTPEGQGVGLVKNMAMMANITICSNSINVRELINEDPNMITFGKETGYNVQIFHDNTKVVINGDIVGVHTEPHIIYKKLKLLKQKGVINIYTSVVWNFTNNELLISTEGGRCVRPLFIVDNDKGYPRCHMTNKLLTKLNEGKLTWREMVTGTNDIDVHDSIIEYMDVEEVNSAMIAMKYDDVIARLLDMQKGGQMKANAITNIEIHPSMIMGVLANLIPFSDHNQAPRVAYQCIWEEEMCLMANGKHKKLKDVHIGDNVMCFNPNTLRMEATKVVNHWTNLTDKKTYKITTFDDNEIVATYDHKFMTNKGWQEVQHFNNDTYLGIQFVEKHMSHDIDEYIILDIETFISRLIDLGADKDLINYHAQALVNFNILPLKSTSIHLPILAKICGFISTDGSINIYEKKNGSMTLQCVGDFGSIEDAEQFEDDISSLGFDKVTIRLSEAEGFRRTYKVGHNGPLPSLLIALGLTIGNHVKVEKLPLPSWIVNGSMQVKREFLSAFQGGDGCKIRFNKSNNGHNYICAMTSQQIVPQYTQSLVNFYQQLIELFQEFDIEVSGPHVKQVEKDRMQVGYKIRDTHDNLINYFENVNYRYCSLKHVESGIVVQYLKYKHMFVKKHKMLMQEIRNLYDNQMTIAQIARHLDYPYDKVASQVRFYRKGCYIGCKFSNEQQIEHFLQHVLIIKNTMFMKVKSIQEVVSPRVCDITVASDNHSFIAGSGFMVHNCSMGKQAVSTYTSNYRYRYDTMGHVLNYGQKRLVKTKMTQVLNNDDLPCGINVIVAIATYTGFNQEDSVILNKSAVDRGLFTSTYYRTYKELNNKNHSNGEEEFFTKPDMNVVKNVKPYNYDKLDETGFVPENTFVQSGDVIIGKVMPTKVDNVIQYKDNSTTLKNNETGFIDRNGAKDRYFTNTNGDGYNFAKIRIRNDRTPTIGDKYSSFHGQKGTCGILYRQEDMPFTADGIVPDIIVNPHAIPSRMTIGQLMECIMGKACAQLGTYGYGTAFNGVKVDEIANILEEKCGMERHGNEILYNSRTGEQIHTEIFIGPTYYQRLKHMVADKVHCLLADHDVLTLDGWKPIPQVTMNDKVATLKDGKVMYEHPINVLHFPNYKGKMYHIQNQQIDLNVTINHRMFVSNCYGRAKEWQPYKLVPANVLVGKNVKYKKDADWTCEDYQFVLPAVNNHQEMIVDMEAWLTFFGIWYAEGWTDNDEYQQTCCNYRVTISVNKKHVKDALFPALERLGFHYWYNPKTEKLSIHNKQLYTYMSPLSVGASNKKLPQWCFYLSKMQTRRLIDSMIIGDGTYPKDTNRKVYYTSSTVIADQFMQLCLHAGWSSNKGVHFEEGTNTPIMKDGRVINGKYAIYRLPVITNKNHPQVNHGHHKQQNIQEEYVYEYNGPVYCLQVPSEVFYIRRNGKPCWTGNSRSNNGPVVMLTRQPAEGRARDGGLRLGEMELECNWAHGTMQFLKERLLECSDNYRIFVCKKCGLMANVNPEQNIYNCRNCKNITDFAECRVPYAFKLLTQEVQTMAIAARFMT
jgi:DNA-directed RNA polymerase beta subunit